MAKPSKTINVNGLSVKDILKMNVNDFRGVSTANLKQVTSRLVSAMNKRIVRLGKSEIGRLSPTYQAFERRGKYSVRNLTRESTIQVFKNLKESFSKKTSLREWKVEREEVLRKIDLEFLKDDTQLESKFWKLYHDYESQDKRLQNIKGVSSEVLAYFKKRFERNPNAKIGTSRQSIRRRIDSLYQEMVNRNKAKTRPSVASLMDDGNV